MTRVALDFEPTGLGVAPALVLPLVGLATLVMPRGRPALGWALSLVGLAVHALTAVAPVSAGC